MKILKLTLKRKWYDLIILGEKLEEYREIKPYWEKRLITPYQSEDGDFEPHFVDFEHFDAIQFTNGYAKNSPSFTIECKGIEIAQGRQDWGAEPDTQYFVIKLGNIIKN